MRINFFFCNFYFIDKILFATNIKVLIYQLRTERTKLISDVEIQMIGSDGHAKARSIDQENT